MNISWDELFSELKDCTKCGLCNGRNNVVIGEGNPHAAVMFIGEGPGSDEDRLGRPFVGRAGQLLDKMIESIGFTRSDVYIANIVKCRPPGNRDPKDDEIQACRGYLRAQVALIHPAILVLLGRVASQAILGSHIRITAHRGIWVEKKGYCIMPTYHPAALLRDPAKKKDSWADMQAIREKFDYMQLKGNT